MFSLIVYTYAHNCHSVCVVVIVTLDIWSLLPPLPGSWGLISRGQSCILGCKCFYPRSHYAGSHFHSFSDSFSCILGWAQAYNEAIDDFELLTLLSSPTECWECRHAPPCLLSFWVTGPHSTYSFPSPSNATSHTQPLSLIFFSIFSFTWFEADTADMSQCFPKPGQHMSVTQMCFTSKEYTYFKKRGKPRIYLFNFS